MSSYKKILLVSIFSLLIISNMGIALANPLSITIVDEANDVLKFSIKDLEEDDEFEEEDLVDFGYNIEALTEVIQEQESKAEIVESDKYPMIDFTNIRFETKDNKIEMTVDFSGNIKDNADKLGNATFVFWSNFTGVESHVIIFIDNGTYDVNSEENPKSYEFDGDNTIKIELDDDFISENFTMDSRTIILCGVKDGNDFIVDYLVGQDLNIWIPIIIIIIVAVVLIAIVSIFLLRRTKSKPSSKKRERSVTELFRSKT